MNTRLTLATILLASLVATEPARANSSATVVEQSSDAEPARNFSIGVAGSNGTSGVELSYRQGRLQLTVGAMAARSRLSFADDTDPWESETSFALTSAAAFYRLAQSDRTRLWIGARTSAYFFAANGSGVEFAGGALDVPIRAELFLADRFSIHLEAGVRVSKSEIQGWENSTYSIGGGELLGNAGFAYHF